MSRCQRFARAAAAAFRSGAAQETHPGSARLKAAKGGRRRKAKELGGGSREVPRGPARRAPGCRSAALGGLRPAGARGSCSLHGHGRRSPGARAGCPAGARPRPSRRWGGGVQPDKEQSRQPNKEVRAGGFQNRSRGKAGSQSFLLEAAFCC